MPNSKNKDLVKCASESESEFIRELDECDECEYNLAIGTTTSTSSRSKQLTFYTLYFFVCASSITADTQNTKVKKIINKKKAT